MAKKNRHGITEHAHKVCQHNKACEALTPEEVLAKVDEIRNDGFGRKKSKDDVCNELNEQQIIRGNWNGKGSPWFTINSLTRIFRAYANTTFSGAQFKAHKESPQTTLPGLAPPSKTIDEPLPTKMKSVQLLGNGKVRFEMQYEEALTNPTVQKLLVKHRDKLQVAKIVTDTSWDTDLDNSVYEF